MAVIDIFTFNGEYDILKMRYEMLKDVVDEFIICEADLAFSGHPKPMYSMATDVFYDPIYTWPKVKIWKIEHKYTEQEVELARNSKYTQGHPRWMLEYLQKEDIKKALTHLKDDDIVYIGDVDEIWEHREPNGIEKLKLRVYTYWLNNLSSEEFWGPIRAYYKDVKDKCFNDIRNDTRYRTTDYQGWHFTNQGGLEAVKQKVKDQYNEEVFNKEIGENLDKRFGVADYIGRDFTFVTDESDWPSWLLINREEFAHLLK